jgi:hypothetical protein
MDALRASAQSLNPNTEKLGVKLLDCEKYRNEAQMWLSFYYRARGDYAKGAELDLKTEKKNNLSERDQIFAAATEGQYEPLLEKVNSGEESYAQDAESLLILSRSLVRRGENSEGRKYYTVYLKFKPDDVEVEIESAYTFIWEGKCALGKSAFSALQLKKTSKALQEKVTQGLLAAERCSTDNVTQIQNHERRESLFSSAVVGGYQGFTALSPGQESHAFRVHSLYGGWTSDFISLWAKGHRISSQQSQGRKNFEGAHAEISAKHSLGANFEIVGRAGFFAIKSGLLTYEAMLTSALSSNSRLSLGIKKFSLAPENFLPDSDLEVARTTAFASIQVSQNVLYRYEFRNTDKSKAFHHHEGEVKLPLLEFPPFQKVAAIFGGELEFHNQRSPFYYSPKQSSLGYLGIEHVSKLNSKASSSFRTDYGLSWEKSYPGEVTENPRTPAVSRGDFLRLRAGGAFPLTDTLLAQLNARFLNNWGSQGRSIYREYSINMELSWLTVDTIK